MSFGNIPNDQEQVQLEGGFEEQQATDQDMTAIHSSG